MANALARVKVLGAAGRLRREAREVLKSLCVSLPFVSLPPAGTLLPAGAGRQKALGCSGRDFSLAEGMLSLGMGCPWHGGTSEGSGAVWQHAWAGAGLGQPELLPAQSEFLDAERG